ncbi:hypothetical protein ACSBR2_037665 [Camellia fascicularis]
MDVCSYFDSCIRIHNRCTSNCLVRKKNIRRDTTTYRPRICQPFGNSSSSSRWYKIAFKENILPSREDTRLFSIGPSIAVVSILLSYSVIPFGYRLIC